VFEYLKKLTVDLENLRDQIQGVPEDQWKYWTNPRGKTVKNYKQIYVKEWINLNYIIDQLPVEVEHGPIVCLRYDPFARLHPHTDWNNISSILIGISKNSEITFWQGRTKVVATYTYPILANLEKTHSVENNSQDYRFVLKIPFKIKYDDMLTRLSCLI